MNTKIFELRITKKVPLIKLKPFTELSSSLTDEKREQFGLEVAKEVLKECKDKSLGVFLGILGCSTEKVFASYEDLRLNFLVVSVKVRALYYDLKENNIVPVLVESVNSRNLQTSCYGLQVQIPLENLHNTAVTYNPSTESCQVGDSKIKAGDFLLLKTNTISMIKDDPFFVVRGTCRNQGAGKINIR